MAAAILVDAKVGAGRVLVDELDQTPVRPFAAFWIWDSDAEQWQFVIGTEMVERQGPTEALRNIQLALNAETRVRAAIELQEILVVGPRDPRLELLRMVPRAGRQTLADPIKVERAVVGGHFVEAAYVYRNSPPTPAADEVVTEAARQASALLGRGQTPRVIELVRQEDAALKRAGVTGDTLVLAAPAGIGPAFVHAGQPYPVAEARRVELRIRRTDRANLIQVAA